MNSEPPAVAQRDREAQTLTIRQETKVGWFDVRQLLATGAKALASTIVGSMSGRREIMAALDPHPDGQMLPDHDYADHDTLWLDYVADTGDGWNATYSVTYLVGRDAVYLLENGEPTPQPIPASGIEEAGAGPDGASAIKLPRASVLILGGDQVYPTASAETYKGRLQDPFECARLGDDPVAERHVYAIPGNHDWYDGLTAFIRLFCQRHQRTIGIWRTQQRRSYFAIRLREGWWLWGADLALEEDLDPPQLDYFISRAEALQPGDRVILCSPSPTWVSAHNAEARQRREIKRQVNKFGLIEDQVKRRHARLVLALAGDLHYYARHEVTNEQPPPNYIICGGGGAFTLGTSQLPSTLHLPNAQTAALRARFPTDAQSRAMRWWALLFPLSSPGFTAVLATYQLLLLYFLHSISRLQALLPSPGIGQRLPWLNSLEQTRVGWRAFPDLLGYAIQNVLADGMTFVFVFAFVGGCIAFAHSGRAHNRTGYGWWIAGLVHGLLQLTCGIACCWVVARFVGKVIPPDYLPFLLVFTVAAGVVIFIVNGVLFGAYLLIGNLTCGMHEQEVFSCQSIEAYKCFLRICLDKDKATIYAIGLRQPTRGWKPAPGVRVKSTFVWPNLSREQVLELPEHTTRAYDPVQPLRPQLIEPPIQIR